MFKFFQHLFGRQKDKKPLIDWGFSCGRYYLKIGEYVAAMEGDPCRDSKLPVRTWEWRAIWEVINAANGEVLDRYGKPYPKPRWDYEKYPEVYRK